ncbi:MAG: biopolymer transporter ExbD [Crocinitomicaceae bacterium]|jgi:biopolymer transport protein ExbD|nr:biopolymer transporter ExbD [Crocinitomicaceae bacterium]
MAKREIPEINAGSMADIAFLLLIFFLVTTTMDRDQAYVRNIPKKIDVIDKVEIEQRNILAIKANSLNQLMVRGTMIADPDDISEKIIEFYQKNEKRNDPTNNFPMYTRIGMDFINTQIDQIDSEIASLESQDAPAEMIDFKYSQIEEWNKKKKSLQLYGGPELPEIHFQANIRIEVQDATEYGLFAKIQTEIEEAIFELRDGESQRIFGEGYGIIKSRYAQDQDPADKSKLDLLEVLYPARIIEVTPKK